MSLSTMTITELLDEFAALEDWDERCDFLIDLGFELPEFPPEEKTEANRVHGCQSNVWMTAEIKPTDPPILEFRADSDAMIVRGLIAVLLAMYSGKTAQEILDLDARAIFAELGLNRHLSPTRRNGLDGMVRRIRSFAEEALNQSPR